MNFLRIINSATKAKSFLKERVIVQECLKRYSSFKSSEFVRDINEYPEIEIVKNPPEWKYVEMLFKPEIIPKPQPKTEYPSGWTPVTANPDQIRYFVNRTKNHMIPVYLVTKYRGQRRLTFIRRIEGDIWELEKDLRKYVESNINKVIATRINELCGQITIHGDHVNLVKEFMKEKGF